MKGPLSALLVLLLAGTLSAGDSLRLVTLSPAMTELVFLLGGEAALVGRSSACDFPEAAAKLPVAGRFGIPSLAKLLELRANAVLTDTVQDPNAVQMLEKAGIRTIVRPIRCLADYRKAVLAVGKLLDREKAARGETARIDRVLREYLERGKRDKTRPKVLFLVWDAPPMAAGGGSHLSEYVRLCGGENVGDASSREFFRCSAEWLLQCGAEVILLPGKMGRSDILHGDVFRELPAAKARRIHTDLNGDDVFRPGPRFERALKAIYQKIHP